jgi:hypothetical protein
MRFHFTTLKEKVREKVAAGISDSGTVFSSILSGWPRNRPRPTYEAVRKYWRQFQAEGVRAAPPQGTQQPSNDEVAEGSRKKKETITVGCHLPNVLTLAAQESLRIATVLQMGLLPVLERLGKRGRELNDPELTELLALLSLTEISDKEEDHEDDSTGREQKRKDEIEAVLRPAEEREQPLH